jgi:dihydroxyacetone kinase
MDIVSIFRIISNTIESSMGGTSGAIYAIFFNAVTNHLSSPGPFDRDDSGSLSMRLRVALSLGVAQLCRYTAARKGHKTLMDALIPFTETFASGSSLEAAVMEARNGAEATRKLDAVLGRASYVGKEIFEVEGGIPDPGAMGVVSVLQGILGGLKDERIIS